MPTQYILRGGVERLIIDNFIKSNNCIDWIANISRTLGKDSSGIEKITKDLTKKNILKEIDCPQELIGKKGKGGAKPRTCYLLNYDMNPMWFVEISRPHLDNDDKKNRKKFMKSGFTSRMIHTEKIIDWIIENKIELNLKEGKEILPFIFNSFPSTLRWILYSDLSAIHNMEKKTELQKRFFLSLLNNKIIEDLLNRGFLLHKELVQMEYSFMTKFDFYGLKPPKGKEGEMVLGYSGITGGFKVVFKEIPEMKVYRPKNKKKT